METFLRFLYNKIQVPIGIVDVLMGAKRKGPDVQQQNGNGKTIERESKKKRRAKYI